MKRKSFFLTGCFFLTAIATYAQINLPKVLHPSPSAAELGKYGEIPINQSTGALNLSIPLYTYSTQNIQLPISLSYSTQGFRVNAIATQVGFDWVLNAGGVITRMVFDEPDLAIATTHWSNPDFSHKNDALYDYLDKAVLDGYDTQPDMFYYNFNGLTGRVIIGDDGQVLTMPHNGMKVEYNYTAESNIYFTITGTDGVKYSFGGDLATETMRNVSACGGQHYIDNVPSAWYLTKIEHPNGDSMVFNYDIKYQNYQSSVNQTLYTRPADPFPIECPGGSVYCPLKENLICYINSQAYVARLTSINSSANGTIEFGYQSRNDILGSDGLLASITCYTNEHVQFRKFTFGYDITEAIGGFAGGHVDDDQKYRPFLNNISEYGTSGSSPKQHKLFYNNLNELPPRLCFAQDEYGYYNGVYYNVDLVPKPTSPTDAARFDNHGGDRSANPDYAQKGLLNKIIYPTGGTTQIFYEGHKISGTRTDWIPNTFQSEVNAIGDNTIFDNGENYIKSTTFTPGTSGTAPIRASFFSLDGTTDSDHHIKLKATVTNVSTGEILYSEYALQNQSIEGNVEVTAGTNYEIKIEFYGGSTWQGGMTVTYTNGGSYVTTPYTVYYPGVRVQKLISNDNTGTNPPQVKKYYYSKIDNLNGTSLFDYGMYTHILPVGGMIACVNGPTIQSRSCSYYMLSSNVLNGESLVSNNVFYTSVLESHGEFFENGGIEYKYLLIDKDGSFPLLNGDMATAPHNNSGLENAELLEQNTFLWRNNAPVYTSKLINTYTTDNRISSIVKGYAIQKNWEPVAGGFPRQDGDFACFDANYYQYKAPWRYLSKTEKYQYDQQTQTPLLVTTNYYYDNPVHVQLTRMEMNDSKQVLKKTVKKYPNDKSDIAGLSANAGAALDIMAGKHIIDPVIQEENYAGGNLLDFKRTDYKVWNTTTQAALPEKVWYKTRTANPEERLTFYVYDQNCNMLEMAKKDDVRKTYIWGYNNNTYPVAEITGASYSSVIALLNQSIIQNPASDQALRNELQKIRQNFPTALVTTFTYKPLIGLTSQTDAGNHTIYYEYDFLGRLKLIRDQDNNVLKSFDYQYQAQP